MGRILISIGLVLGLLDAQQVAQHEPLDLEAIAKVLDVGEPPSVLDQMPKDLQEQFVRLEPFLPTDAGDELEWEAGSIWLAIRVLRQSKAKRGTATGLYREIRACHLIAGLGKAGDRVESILGHLALPVSQECGRVAEQRERGLASRFLRKHPTDPRVGYVLLPFCQDLAGVTPLRVCADVVGKLGATATSNDFRSCANAALASFDLAAANAWFERANAAPRPQSRADRREWAMQMFDLRRRLQGANRLADETTNQLTDTGGPVARTTAVRAARLELRNDLWVLPKLPDRAWLQQVVDGK